MSLPDQLIHRPGAQRTLTIQEVMQRVNGFLNQCVGLEAVVIVHRQGAPLDQSAVSRTTDRTQARALLRAVLHAYETDALKSGAGGDVPRG